MIKECIFFYICPYLKSMIWIERPHIDPWFNLAAEEYILKQYKQDLLMFWQNTPSVVVGKHQNTAAEVDMDYAAAHHIPVIRRISGGGTVYHDLGNINYTLIRSTAKNEFPVDFRAFTQPLIAFLASFGIDARFEGKNNLLIGGRKFSGNAAHLFKNRVMHHGTILFQTDLEKLEKIIQPKQGQFNDKAIKSVHAKVMNLSEIFPKDISFDKFKVQLKQFLLDYYKIETSFQLTDADLSAIHELANTKYKSWQWNVGYSPKFSVQKSETTPYGIIRAKLQVKAGIITSVDLFFEDKRLITIEEQLLNQPYQKEQLMKTLTNNRFAKTLVNTLF